MSDLNRWIAENVMGWEWIDRLHLKDKNGEHVVDGREWRPDTDISQAFQVVEKMRGCGWWLTLHQISCVEAPWKALFRFGGMWAGHRPERESKSNNPATAICLAAKMAKEARS